MSNKVLSKIYKLVIVLAATTASVLKWVGILPSADIDEIWKVAGYAYLIGMGVMDFNITADNIKEKWFAK